MKLKYIIGYSPSLKYPLTLRIARSHTHIYFPYVTKEYPAFTNLLLLEITQND